jgi:uncharacterized membrane protein YdjX (TVP38/TMEM64 family)
MDQEVPMGGRQGLGEALRRFLPLAVLVAAVVAFFALGLGRYLTFQALAEHREWLLAEVARLGFAAPLAFMAIYTTVIALSVPGGAFLTVTAGFLFGTWFGGLYAVIAATCGATVIFLIARTSFGEPLRRRAGPFLRKLEAGFQENAASYLLVLRLVPAFPFWLVNLVPAFLGVSVRTYVVFSFIGMAPATFVYASLGEGLGAIIEAGQSPDLGIIFQWRVLGPLIALAALASLPVIYRWYKARRRMSSP